MAINWKNAQLNERRFWESVYVDKKKDIETYLPITADSAIAFSKTTLKRHGYTFSDTKNKTVLDLGCGPYGIIKGLSEAKNGEYLNELNSIIGIDPLMDIYRKFDLIKKDKKINLLKAKGEGMLCQQQPC